MKDDVAFIAAIDDLIFQSRVRTLADAFGAKVVLSMIPGQVLQELQASTAVEKIVIVDLNASTFDAIEFVRQVKQEIPDVQVIGFCHHMDTELIRQSKLAHIDTVVPRGKLEVLLKKMFRELHREHE